VLKSGLQREGERPPAQRIDSYQGKELGLAEKTDLRRERQPRLGKKTQLLQALKLVLALKLVPDQRVEKEPRIRQSRSSKF